MNVNIGNKAENTIVVKGLVIVECLILGVMFETLIVELWKLL